MSWMGEIGAQAGSAATWGRNTTANDTCGFVAGLLCMKGAIEVRNGSRMTVAEAWVVRSCSSVDEVGAEDPTSSTMVDARCLRWMSSEGPSWVSKSTSCLLVVWYS